MIHAFKSGCRELEEIWKMALQPSTLQAIQALADARGEDLTHFHLDDDLWTRVVFEFAAAYRNNPMMRSPLLQSLAPLYLGRVASFVIDTEKLVAREVEEKIEHLCLSFERQKPYLLALWEDQPIAGSQGGDTTSNSPGNTPESALEVKNV
jgi:hypothetical protein